MFPVLLILQSSIDDSQPSCKGFQTPDSVATRNGHFTRMLVCQRYFKFSGKDAMMPYSEAALCPLHAEMFALTFGQLLLVIKHD